MSALATPAAPAGRVLAGGIAVGLAPGLAAWMAWPVLDHVPTGAEASGLALAMTGLIVAVTAPLAAQLAEFKAGFATRAVPRRGA